ncbi:MAG: DUF3795 domain-containing protein [Eubacteriales bacterium]|nr:DUF3795 domain-containing protein [Eubacteriales bacterium]
MTEFPYGYCGMPCALCTRYRTDGKSKCAGCSHSGYYTDVCKVYRCCREKGFLHCGCCPEVPCVRLGRMGDFSDLNTNHVKPRTCKAVSSEGFDAWYAQYEAKAKLLTVALERYNNGRMKRYLCELFIQQDLPVLQEIMERAAGFTGDRKEQGKAFRALAEELLASRQS